MPEKRKRNLTLTIRVTPDEKDAILKKAKQADMTLTDYLVTSALTTRIFVAEDLKPALSELKDRQQPESDCHQSQYGSLSVLQFQRSDPVAAEAL